MRVRAAAMAVVLVCLAPHSASAEADAGDIAAGQALAERLCRTCHLNPGQGEKSGPAGIPGFRAVANRPGQTLSAVIAWLKTAPPMMPNHHLSQDEMHRLAAFIMSLREGE